MKLSFYMLKPKVIFPFKTVFCVTGLILHMHLHIYNSAADGQDLFHKVAQFAKIHSGMILFWIYSGFLDHFRLHLLSRVSIPCVVIIIFIISVVKSMNATQFSCWWTTPWYSPTNTGAVKKQEENWSAYNVRGRGELLIVNCHVLWKFMWVQRT